MQSRVPAGLWKRETFGTGWTVVRVCHFAKERSTSSAVVQSNGTIDRVVQLTYVDDSGGQTNGETGTNRQRRTATPLCTSTERAIGDVDHDR